MELTADQQTSVNSLKEIADIEDRDILIAVLIESKWDLDRAVKTLMSDEQPFLSSTPDKQSSTNSSLSSSNSVQSHNHHSDRSSYIASQSDSLHNTSSQQPKLSIFSFAVAPFTLTISTIYKIILYIC